MSINLSAHWEKLDIFLIAGVAKVLGANQLNIRVRRSTQVHPMLDYVCLLRHYVRKSAITDPEKSNDSVYKNKPIRIVLVEGTVVHSFFYSFIHSLTQRNMETNQIEMDQ